MDSIEKRNWINNFAPSSANCLSPGLPRWWLACLQWCACLQLVCKIRKPFICSWPPPLTLALLSLKLWEFMHNTASSLIAFEYFCWSAVQFWKTYQLLNQAIPNIPSMTEAKIVRWSLDHRSFQLLLFLVPLLGWIHLSKPKCALITHALSLLVGSSAVFGKARRKMGN